MQYFISIFFLGMMVIVLYISLSFLEKDDSLLLKIIYRVIVPIVLLAFSFLSSMDIFFKH
jgi:hypothetical protein